MHLNQRILIIRRTPVGEADLIITALNEGGGKISAIARQARKSQRRFSGGLEPLDTGRARLSKRSHRGRTQSISWVIEDFTSEIAWSSLRTDLSKLLYAAAFLEVADALIPEEDHYPETPLDPDRPDRDNPTNTPYNPFDLLSIGLTELHTAAEPIAYAAVMFTTLNQLLQNLGFASPSCFPKRSIRGLLSVLDQIESIAHRSLRSCKELRAELDNLVASTRSATAGPTG